MNTYLGEDLILVLSAPRSGSTMVQRILGTHSAIQTHPEPHILTPLAFQGYFHQVERAAYNHKVAAGALREFVDFLPRGEEDYLDACRAYCRVLYGRARSVGAKPFFLDKTPNYADTILPFISRLLPRARFVVLTRHPVAQIASVANTFLGGDFQRALFQRNYAAAFIPPLAHFMRTAEVPYIHIRYEDLVTAPEPVVRRLLDHIGLPFEPECLRFGEAEHITKTYGDPNIGRYKSPVDESMHRWVDDLVDRPDRERACREALRSVSTQDLEIFGYPADTLWQPLLDARTHRSTHASNAMTLRTRWQDWVWRARGACRAALRRPSVGRVLVRASNVLNTTSSQSWSTRGE